MSIYKVIAKQVYYVEADTSELAHMYFINDDEEHIGIGFTEVVSIEEESGAE